MQRTERSTSGVMALLLAGTLATAGAAILWGVAPALGLVPGGQATDGGAGSPLLALVIMLGGAGILLVAMAAGEFLGHAHDPPGP
jgi:hypothetical protein